MKTHTDLDIGFTVVSGGAAGNITVTGIKEEDVLIGVLHLVGDGTQLDGGNNDLTSEFSITGDDTINNEGGTATTNGVLFVFYLKADDLGGDLNRS